MASAFARVEGGVDRQRPKKRGKPRLVVMHGGRELEREEGAALCLEVSRRILARHERSRMASRLERIDKLPPERRSLEAAMLSVEEAFVKALWILQRTEGGEGAIGLVTACSDCNAGKSDRKLKGLPKPIVVVKKRRGRKAIAGDPRNRGLQLVRKGDPNHHIINPGAIVEIGESRGDHKIICCWCTSHQNYEWHAVPSWIVGASSGFIERTGSPLGRFGNAATG